MPVGVAFVGRPKNRAPEPEEPSPVPPPQPMSPPPTGITPVPVDGDDEDEDEDAVDTDVDIVEVPESYIDMGLRELKRICEERGFGEKTEKGNWKVMDKGGNTVSRKEDIANLLRADDEARASE